MFFIVGLVLLFFLPIIESFDRSIGFNLLIIGALLVSFSTFWKKKIYFDLIELLWFFMILIFLLTTIFSWSISPSYTELTRYLAYFLFFITVRNIQNKEQLIRKFYYPSVVINGLLLSFLFILSLFPIFKIPPPENGLSLFYPLYRHNRITDILVFAIPLSFNLLNLEINKIIKIFIVTLIIFLLIIMILSTGLGAMASLFLALFFYALFKPKIRWIILTQIWGTVVIFLILGSFIFSTYFSNLYNGNKLLSGFFKPLKNEYRVDYFTQGITGFSNSFLIGTGLDTFRYVSKRYQDQSYHSSWYAHNHYLQLFTETGFLGGSVFLLLISLIFIRIIKQCQLPTDCYQLHQGILIALFASAIHSLIDFDWQFLSVFLFFWMGIALALPEENRNNSSLNSLSSKIFFMTAAVILLIPLILPLNSERRIKRADQYFANGQYQESINILTEILPLDKKNFELLKKMAEIYKDTKNIEKAHYWYQKAILLNPLDSASLIKDDYLLYLQEAKKFFDNGNFDSGYSILLESVKRYPFFYFLSDGDKYFAYIKYLKIKNKKKELIAEIINYVKKTQKVASEYKPIKEDLRIVTQSLMALNVY